MGAPYTQKIHPSQGPFQAVPPCFPDGHFIRSRLTSETFPAGSNLGLRQFLPTASRLIAAHALLSATFLALLFLYDTIFSFKHKPAKGQPAYA